MKFYEEQSGVTECRENIKRAVLEKYLFDGELAADLNLQSGRLTTYDLARKEAINYLQAKSDVDCVWNLGSDRFLAALQGQGRARLCWYSELFEFFFCGLF